MGKWLLLIIVMPLFKGAHKNKEVNVTSKCNNFRSKTNLRHKKEDILEHDIP